MNLMCALSRISYNQLKTVNSLLVILQSCKYKSLVIFITQDVHGTSLLFEACDWMFNYMQGMLIAFSFNAKFSKLSMKRTTHLLVVISNLIDNILKSLNTIDCLLLR